MSVFVLAGLEVLFPMNRHFHSSQGEFSCVCTARVGKIILTGEEGHHK